MTTIDQWVPYRSVVDTAVQSLERIGVSSSTACILVRDAFNIFYKGAPISDRCIGEYKTLEVRAILQSAVRPHAMYVRGCDRKRREIMKKRISVRTSEESEEYAGATEIVQDYKSGSKSLDEKISEVIRKKLISCLSVNP